jgi:molybdenum cofactor guanylyltransferase
VTGYAAVILAGGAGRRLGGRTKPALPVGGRPMLERVLDAVADAAPRVVVGPSALAVPAGVLRTCEEPPGGGPVAALAAGLTEVASVDTVAVLAADLPFLTRGAVATLRRALQESTVDGAVYVDPDGRRQTLCGVWLRTSLTERLAALERQHGTALRDLLAGLRVREVAAGERPVPWYDCDTPEDLDRAERWA